MMARRATGEQPRREIAGKLHPVSESLSEGIILIDSNFVPMAMDSGAEAIVHDLKKGHGASEGVHGFTRRIRAFFDSRDEGDWHGVQLSISAGEHEYSCRAFLVKMEQGATVVALHLRREVSLDDAVHQIAAEYHLTDREQEALMGVSRGLTSKEVAAQMKISPNTVKAFLRLIMIKMGTASRAGLVAKLLDQNRLRVSL